VKNYIGLDVGDRRIGVAVSRLGTMAMPLEVVSRDGSELDRIAALSGEHEADAIVAGMPFSMDGSLKPQAHKVQAFLDELSQRVETPILTVDERLTTAQADRMLIAADRRSKDRKRVVDQVAATLILQAYLDREAARGPEGEG
jgi:putative holliday junction resolvase